MQRLKLAALVVALFLTTGTIVQAQTGCTDSPENPTVIFGLITAAVSLGLARFRNRKGSRDK